MSGAARAPLRLAHAAPAAVVQVLIGDQQAFAAGPSLRLLPPGWPAPADGSAAAPLALPGLGARYLAAVARRAAAAGWQAPELTALVAELAPRCGYLSVRGRRDRRLRPFAEAAATRGAICLAAVCGRPPRPISAQLDQLAAAGVRLHRISTGAGWLLELLAVPRLSGPQLQVLRERLAAAPRCDWCGLPVPGSYCRRCSAEPGC